MIDQLIKKYPHLKMEVYECQLSSGLRLILLPKAGFQEKQVSLSVPMGSLTLASSQCDKQQSYPMGLAHFLEHKLFERPDGQDALDYFSARGIDANAYTTYQQTVYHFSTVNDIVNDIDDIVNVFSSLTVTDASVLREKAIIKNELAMYDDDPDYQLYKGVLANLFPHSPLSEDIGGTASSVDSITLADLENAYEHFYQWPLVSMVIVGDIDPEKTISQVETVIQDTSDRKKAQPRFVCLEKHPVIKSSKKAMPIKQSKLGIGFRSDSDLTSIGLQKCKIALQLFLSMVMGWTSGTYQKWYGDSLIDYSFDLTIELSEVFNAIIITFDTDQPIAMSTKIRQTLFNYKNNSDFTEEHLDLVKKEMYGQFISSLDSIEDLAHQVTTSFIYQGDYLSTGDMIKQMTLDDIVTVVDCFIESAEMSTFTLFPQ